MKILNLGVVGLGRAFTLMLPTFLRDDRYRLYAAATPGPVGREAFAREFGGAVYDTAEALCADPAVDVVYIASPHQFHCEHVELAARAGKHCLLDKPIAISLEEAQRIVRAVEQAGVVLVAGPAHSFDAPVLRAKALIDGGEFGRLRQLQAVNYTDFLYRPRRPEELDTERGGGVVFSQGIHQVDVVRLLAGGMGRSVYAMTGNWDPERPTEGAYSALLEFDEDVFAALTYNGYGRFDSDEFMHWIGELGYRKDPRLYGSARRRLEQLAGGDEAMLKRERNFGYVDTASLAETFPYAHEHFGLVVASCERADLRLYPTGVEVFADERRFEKIRSPHIPRREVMDELYGAVVEGRAPLHSARWALASLEVAIAILDSARSRQPVRLHHQVPASGN